MRSKYDLFKYFGELGFSQGVEIGVSQGYVSEAMFKAIPGLKLYCVDIWKKYPENRWSSSVSPKNLEITKNRLSKYDATLIQDMSMNAVKRFAPESLDFVYIDSNHSFDWVMQDLIEWSRRVRSGGIVSGDDYYHFRGAGVVEAVDAYTKAHGIKFNLTAPDGLKDRDGIEQPSYWWIKQ